MRSRDGGDGDGGGPPVADDVRYQRLYRQAWPRVLAYLISLDHRLDHASAEELAQGTFMILWLRWDEVRFHRDPMGFLIITAHHLWQNHRRSEQRHPVDPLTDRDGWAPVDETDLALAVTLRQALTELTLRQRQVILLRYLLDLSVKQTADILGIVPGTVTWTTKEAVAALGRLIDPEGGGRDG